MGLTGASSANHVSISGHVIEDISIKFVCVKESNMYVIRNAISGRIQIQIPFANGARARSSPLWIPQPFASHLLSKFLSRLLCRKKRLLLCDRCSSLESFALNYLGEGSNSDTFLSELPPQLQGRHMHAALPQPKLLVKRKIMKNDHNPYQWTNARVCTIPVFILVKWHVQ